MKVNEIYGGMTVIVEGMFLNLNEYKEGMTFVIATKRNEVIKLEGAATLIREYPQFVLVHFERGKGEYNTAVDKEAIRTGKVLLLDAKILTEVRKEDMPYVLR